MPKYSQRDEETCILKALEGIQNGKFLDIGAYDGVNFSNTMALVERGWSGVMVEPGLEAFQALLKNHGDKEAITLVHAAVGTERGMSKFWNSPTSYGTTEEWSRDRCKLMSEFSPAFFVPVITFDDLWQWVPGMPVDMLSIDTEGTSVDLLMAFPIEICRPKVVCVEHDSRFEECRKWATDNRYFAHMANEENVVFVRD